MLLLLLGMGGTAAIAVTFIGPDVRDADTLIPSLRNSDDELIPEQRDGIELVPMLRGSEEM